MKAKKLPPVKLTPYLKTWGFTKRTLEQAQDVFMVNPAGLDAPKSTKKIGEVERKQSGVSSRESLGPVGRIIPCTQSKGQLPRRRRHVQK
jgi:hypothetical protein